MVTVLVLQHRGAPTTRSLGNFAPQAFARELDVSSIALKRMARYDSLTDAIAEATADGRWMSTDDIADVIAERDLWRRPSDGNHPNASQIGWRIRKNPTRFEIDGKQARSR